MHQKKKQNTKNYLMQKKTNCKVDECIVEEV